MRLRKIQLHNFRPYYGEVVVEFPERPHSDFYLVHGQNGYGKTSVLMAVQWALYGEGRVRDVFEHMNTRARSEPDPRMGVDLVFEHDGEEFLLRREAKPARIPIETPQDVKRSEVTLYRNGVPVNPPDVAQERIETILPRDASQFFLFDAEKNNRYSATQLTDDTRTAIELVLGMRPVQNARDDAETLRAEIRRRRNQELRKNGAHAELASHVELLQEELASLRARENELIERIRAREAQRDEYRTELDRLNEVQALARERDQWERQVAETRRRRDSVIEELQREARGLYLRVLQPRVTAAYEESLAQYEALRESESIARQQEAIARYLERLLERERCVCGRDLDEHHRTEVKEALDQVSRPPVDTDGPSQSATEVAARLEALRRARSKTETAARRYDGLQVQKLDLDEELSGYETKLTQVKSQIRAIDLDQANSLRELINGLEDEIRLMHREHGALTQQIEQKQKELATKDREVSRLSNVGTVVAALDAQIDLLERASKAFDALLERSARARRSQIGERANTFFRSITNKEFGYESMFIADDFTFGIRASDGSQPDMDNISEGEKQVVAFCFVMGLNRYAKANAPLMIDTPMARLDKVHRRNMARALREIGQQAILFVTDMDLEAGVGDIFAEFVEREFEIIHDQSTLSSTIKIKGASG